jgi:FkbM family methyltransferase
MRRFAREVLGRPIRAEDPTPDLMMGFKEIRFFHRVNHPQYSTVPEDELLSYASFLRCFFPGVKFVYVDREPEEIASSSWWTNVDKNQLITDIELFKQKILSQLGNDLIHVKHEELRKKNLDYIQSNLFSPLDIPFDERNIANILSTPLLHLKKGGARQVTLECNSNISDATQSLKHQQKEDSAPPRIFLDFRANYFQGLEFFTNKLGLNEDWIVSSFEANPYIYNKAKQNVESPTKKHGFKDFIFTNAAVSVYDGSTSMSCTKGEIDENGNIVKEGDFGSSSIVGRSDSRFNTKLAYEDVKVRTLDILSIVEDAVIKHKNPHLYIKCDIEGAEYEVLPRLLQSKHLSSIKEMHIEWHSRLFGEKASEMKKLEATIIEKLESAGIIANRHWEYYIHQDLHLYFESQDLLLSTMRLKAFFFNTVISNLYLLKTRISTDIISRVGNPGALCTGGFIYLLNKFRMHKSESGKKLEPRVAALQKANKFTYNSQFFKGLLSEATAEPLLIPNSFILS